MAWEEVRLAPGFDAEKTPTLNQAGISDGAYIRWKEGIPEKLGGWARFFPTSVGSIPRELHPWRDVNGNLRLAVGAAAALKVITAGTIIDITPQTTTTNTPPNFATVSGSAAVTIVDANISNPSTNNSVFIATPVSVGGLVLFGIYPIATVISATSYTITAAALATGTRSPSAITAATWAATAGGQVTFTTTGATGIAVGEGFSVVGMTPAGYNGEYIAIAGTAGTTVIAALLVNPGASSVFGTLAPGAVRLITTANGSAVATITSNNHGVSAGQTVAFLVPTTVNGLLISGSYLAQAPVTSSAYAITVNGLANATGSAFENGGNCQFIYYIAIGPQSPFSGWGVGTWGGGGWGTGTALPSGAGTPITASDWTLENWGEILLACPAGGAIYQWGPESAFQNASVIPQAPIQADGIFIAQPQQILVVWGASNNGVPNPMRIAWSDAGNFTVFVANSGNFAGGFTIPRGSTIVRCMQAPNQFLVWTDLAVWSGQYIGQPDVFAITEVMTGCGLIGRKAAGVLDNVVYWMSQKQFFSMAAGGAPQVMPCRVWDYIFQNLDTANAGKVRCFTNAPFNEVGWYFPSKTGGTGENDRYVKYNPIEGEWDYGPMGRSAWTDQSVLGPPIGGTATGLIYQHEVSPDGDGAAINAFIQTGDFVLGKGEEFQFIDYMIPNFRYGYVGQPQTASMLITFFVKNFADDTPTSSGPFTVGKNNPSFIEPHLRGRLGSLRIESQDIGSFWRGGLLRYRVAPDGRNP